MIKKFISNNIELCINIFLFLFFFIPLFLSTKDFLTSFLFSGSLILIVVIITYIQNYIGKNFHSKIIYKKIFSDLRWKGFRIEKIAKYEGLIKTIDGRTVRVFYNWDKFAEGFLSFGDIEINIFYEPLLLDKKEGEVNIQLLKDLNKKYDKTFWSKRKRTRFCVSQLKIYFNYYPWTKSTRILNEINRGLKVINENNIIPLDINEIKDQYLMEAKENGHFLPWMQHIWEYLEENEKIPS